jgi:hypothetical protein
VYELGRYCNGGLVGCLHVPNPGLHTKLTAHWHIRKTDVKKSENDDEETEDKLLKMEIDKQNKTLPERSLTALYCSDAVHERVY